MELIVVYLVARAVKKTKLANVYQDRTKRQLIARMRSNIVTVEQTTALIKRLEIQTFILGRCVAQLKEVLPQSIAIEKMKREKLQRTFLEKRMLR